MKIESRLKEGTKITLAFPKFDPPSWFVESLKLSKDSMIISVDDDQTIHQIWKDRLMTVILNQRNIEHLTFTSLSVFEDWYLSKGRDFDFQVLIDYEFIDQGANGLQLIEKLDIGHISILVSSRFEEMNIVKQCEFLGVNLIPKSMAPFVPIITN